MAENWHDNNEGKDTFDGGHGEAQVIGARESRDLIDNDDGHFLDGPTKRWGRPRYAYNAGIRVVGSPQYFMLVKTRHGGDIWWRVLLLTPKEK